MSDLAKKFVSEEEVEESKRKRQEEWEKVRRPDQPKEAPEEEYDPRSLYERLQEQKNKKEEEYEEAHKLKNQVRGLDEDESDFLDYVSERQQELQREKKAEEDEVLKEYRNKVQNNSSSATTSRDFSKGTDKKTPKQTAQSKSSSQMKLLAGAVKRKSSDNSGPSDKKAREENGDSQSITAPASTGNLPNRGHAVVVGLLPGLGEYTASSDETSDSCSDDSDCDTDLFRKHVTPCAE